MNMQTFDDLDEYFLDYERMDELLAEDETAQAYAKEYAERLDALRLAYDKYCNELAWFKNHVRNNLRDVKRDCSGYVRSCLLHAMKAMLNDVEKIHVDECEFYCDPRDGYYEDAPKWEDFDDADDDEEDDADE